VRTRAKVLMTVRTVGSSVGVDALLPGTKLLLDLALLKPAVRGGNSGDGKREGVDDSCESDGGGS
jgi:hypothetical protein